jgi:serine/threonine protein kinase
MCHPVLPPLQVIAQGIDEDDLPTYNDKVDVWSMGVVLYEALSGLQPFLANSSLDMLSVIGKKMAQRADPDQLQQHHHHRPHHHLHWSFKQPQDMPAFISQLQVSPDAKDFLACCLTWDPQQRSSAAELLTHPWVLRMQDEAAAVAASRACSRRVSMQAQRARLSEAAEASNPAIARNSKVLPLGGADAAAVSLVDPVMSDMLTGHDVDRQYSRANSLDLMATGLERSMTSEQLEVGAHNVLRTHTQRLDSRPMHARVHAA